MVIHLGPMTAHRAGRSGEIRRTVARKQFGRPGVLAPALLNRLIFRRYDSVLLFFGEIDVRAHFARRLPEYGTAEALSRHLAQRLAAEGRELATRTGARVGIAGLTPPAELVSDPEYPTEGSAVERVTWTHLMNAELENACRRFELVFVDSYEGYANEAGLLDVGRSDGSVHIDSAETGDLWQRCEQAFTR